MVKYEFRAPEVIVTGLDCLESLGEHIKKYGNKALIVTDEIMVKVGLTNRVASLLMAQKLECEIFAEVNAEPIDKHVEEGVKLFKKANCDLVIGLGGGSCLDAAKAIAFMAKNPGKIQDYMGLNKLTVPPAPIIAIPTTAGTGSEVTKVTIITDTVNNVKMLIMDPALTPRVAIVDPLLTLSAPPSITAATGIDALTHAIEAFISRKAQPLTDVLALSAINRIYQNLRSAWSDGSNQEARNQVMIGALEAGLAFSNASVALVHGMSRPIGAYFHVPHGVSNAILLSIVMEWTVGSVPEKFAQIARAMGEKVDGLPVTDAAMKAVEAVKRLCVDIKIPSINELNISPERMKELTGKMAEDALMSRSPENNPRIPTKDEIVNLYMKLIE